MASSNPNRATIIGTTFKVLKKHYKPVAPVGERSVLENLLYACCLEDSQFETADECFARLQESFFDWNEVRVTTIRELAEVLRGNPSAFTAAANLKQLLQSVFESHYSFDLEHLKKQNLGKALAVLEKYRGATPFCVAYVAQTALGGHSIPLGRGGLQVMSIVGAASPQEAAAGGVPGLERAVPKSKGVEFSSLLHQLAADLIASPHSPKLRAILLEIAPDCKDRLPKRIDKKKQQAERQQAERQQAEAAEAKKSKAKPKSAKPGKSTGESAAKSNPKSPPAKPAAPKKSSAASSSPPKKAKTGKKATAKTSGKSASKQLARRKPR